LAHRPLSELSGGERQRLFIAQALVGTPKLLLLDEPLISLDPAHQRSIVELVREVAKERKIAVLFSAHEINPLLRAVDKVLYLGGGKAVLGTIDEIIDEAVLSALYRTPVRVVRADGRIFVIAEDGVLDGHDHDHQHDHDHHSLERT
jgi:zinc/manganese transport system ATP-binding protein